MMIDEQTREAALERGREALIGGSAAHGVRKPVIVRSRGARVWDDQGREYIDLASQSWTNNIGGSDPRIAEAAYRQALELSHIRSMYQQEPQLLLAAALVDVAPPGLSRVALSLHATVVPGAVEASVQ